ncbi:MAG: leucine-rich repeat domain-containing protein, partial [Ruminococcus sp.]|nr:leucine-rich repeat domain-containing protein [Ruminococcus sp.]
MSSRFKIKNGVLIGVDLVSGDITIPINVTEIAPNVFEGCEKLTSVTIPDGVTKIGASAFSDCSNITRISIPDSVVAIGEAAFAGCEKLKSIVLPSRLRRIESELFSGCKSLTAVNVPDNVECIEELAFAYTSLKRISISINVKRIVLDSFCSAFFGSTLEHIDIIDDPSENAPYKHYAGYYRSHDGVLYSGDDEDESLVFIPPAKSGDFKIPSTVTHIRKNSFTSSKIRTVYIPASVRIIEREAFNNCKQLENIFVDPMNQFFSDYSGVLYSSKNERTLVRCPEGKTSVVLSEHTRTIDKCAFYSCKKIRELTIPNKAVTIKDFAFFQCSSLKKIHIPSAVNFMGYGSFNDTPWLNNLAKQNGLVIVNNILLAVDDARYGTIRVPDGVIKIAPGAFSSSNFREVYLPETVTVIGESAFAFSKLEKIVLKEGLHTIGSRAFEECDLLKEITLPSTIRNIKDAFEDSYLSQINIDSGKSKYYASKGGLLYTRDGKRLEVCPPACREIEIAEGTQRIHSKALRDCNSIKRLTLPCS